MYLLLFVCWLCITVAETIGSDLTGNVIEYEVGEVLQFSCKNGSSRWKRLYQVRHELDGVNITVPSETESMINLTYTIIAHDFDHESKVFCVRKQKIFNETTTYQVIESEPKILSLRSGNRSAICENRHEGKKSNNHYCKKIKNMRIDNGNDVTAIQEKAVLLKNTDSGCISFCTNLHKIGSNKYTRNIYNKTKYLYHQRPWLPIGAITEVALILILVTIYLFLRKKRHRPANVTTRSKEDVEQLYAAPHQLVYAELELANRSPSVNVPPVREEAQYTQIIGCVAKKKQTI
ncbi:uncharacterized protein LOC115444772 [Manduca sexta]|uniref:uncharacterized protein LOC115444772 n=1 Tax=Manduca sexta TaxID=7130 RepID=UPI00188F4256|nr:uncharacterized protein LOC115444772 [Manduca sexta]